MERLKAFLGNHWTIISSLAIGVLVGVYAPGIGKLLKPAGDIYFNLIVLCCTIMLPIIITTSIGRVIIAMHSAGFIARIFIGLFCTFGAVAMISIVAAYLVSPITAPNSATVKAMGKLMVSAHKHAPTLNDDALQGYYFIHELDTEKEIAKPTASFGETLAGFFPDNIFDALAHRKTVGVLIFSMIFGLLFKFLPPRLADELIHAGESLFEAFNTMLTFLLYALPFGIIALMANETIGLDFGILLPLMKLAELIALVFLIIFIVCIVVIRCAARKPLTQILSALQEPMVLSFVAENLVAMPALIKALTDKLGFDKNKTGSTVPLWMGLEIHADIAVFAAASIFTLQLYQVPVGFTELAIVLCGSIAAGLSSLAAAAILWVALIKMVLDPLGIPAEPIIFALMLFEPFFNGLLFLLNAVISCAAVCVVVGKPKATGVPA